MLNLFLMLIYIKVQRYKKWSEVIYTKLIKLNPKQ